MRCNRRLGSSPWAPSRQYWLYWRWGIIALSQRTLTVNAQVKLRGRIHHDRDRCSRPDHQRNIPRGLGTGWQHVSKAVSLFIPEAQMPAATHEARPCITTFARPLGFGLLAAALSRSNSTGTFPIVETPRSGFVQKGFCDGSTTAAEPPPSRHSHHRNLNIVRPLGITRLPRSIAKEKSQEVGPSIRLRAMMVSTCGPSSGMKGSGWRTGGTTSATS